MNPDEDRLSSKPLRNWLLAWHIHTGDPLQVIATGFDLPVELVADLLGPRPPLMLQRGEALAICARLRIAPASAWPSFHQASLDQPTAVDAPTAEIPSYLLRVVGGFG